MSNSLSIVKKTVILLLLVLWFGESYSQQPAIKIACVGNSITAGSNNYPSILQNILGDGCKVGNFGHGGATLLRKGDMPYWQTEEFEQAQKFSPDIVIIKLGTNDTKSQNRIYLSEFNTDLTDLINTFRKLPTKPKIYLCLPVPSYTTDIDGINDSVMTTRIIPMIKKVAKSQKTRLIDLHQALSNKSELFPDHIHPNKQGSELIAATIYQTLAGSKELKKQ